MNGNRQRAYQKRSEKSHSLPCNRKRLNIQEEPRGKNRPVVWITRTGSSASSLRQHAEHATVLHGDSTWGAAGSRVPVSEAGDAEERQHVRLGAGVNFRRAPHKPSQGKRQKESVSPNSIYKWDNFMFHVVIFFFIGKAVGLLRQDVIYLWMLCFH